MDDSYYRIYEIAVALREYLKEGYRILYEMLSLINISSDVPYEASIKILQGDATNLFGKHIIYKNGPYDGKILLFISKSGFSPARMLRDYKTSFMEEENPLYSIDHAVLTIENEDGNFVFKRRFNHDIPNIYSPKLSILDINKFSKLYQRLENEGYLTYPSIMYFNSDPMFTFTLNSQCISLQQTQLPSLRRHLMIQYDPSNDSLFVRDNRKNPELTTVQMFCQQIAKREMHEGYAAIIDKYLNGDKLPDSMFDLGRKKYLKIGNYKRIIK